MPVPQVFEYSLLQLVPDAARQERLNVGLMLYCKRLNYLGMLWHWPQEKIALLFPQMDAEAAHQYLQAFAGICQGQTNTALSQLDAGSRFRWLTAPRNTVLQSSALHTGLCDEPEALLQKLFAQLVL